MRHELLVRRVENGVLVQGADPHVPQDVHVFRSAQELVGFLEERFDLGVGPGNECTLMTHSSTIPDRRSKR